MRNRLVAIVVAAVILTGADWVLWRIATRVLAARATSWIAQSEAAGWTVSTGDRVALGWPFMAGLAMERVALTGGERALPGGLAWSADHMVLSISLAHPLTLRISVEGQQFLRLSHMPDLAFTAGEEAATWDLLTGHAASAAFQATGVAGGIAGSQHPQDVQLAALSLRLRQDKLETGNDSAHAQLELRATGIGLPDIGRWPLGATIASAGATLSLTSPPSGDQGRPAPPGQSRAAAQATAWRDGGGRLAVRDAELRWGPLAMVGDAMLKLDDRLQPAGSGTADVAGTAAALDAATQGGLIPAGVAMTAKAVLTVMPAAPGRDAIRLPFVLRDSTLSIGAIPIARLGDIAWGR